MQQLLLRAKIIFNDFRVPFLAKGARMPNKRSSWDDHKGISNDVRSAFWARTAPGVALSSFDELFYHFFPRLVDRAVLIVASPGR